MVLSQIKSTRNVKGRAVVTALQGPPEIVSRLRELGFYEGIKLEVIQKLPFGGPSIVQIGSSSFALREEEADCAHVKLESDT